MVHLRWMTGCPDDRTFMNIATGVETQRPSAVVWAAHAARKHLASTDAGGLQSTPWGRLHLEYMYMWSAAKSWAANLMIVYKKKIWLVWLRF